MSEIKNPLIYNPKTRKTYVDDPYRKDDFEYNEPVMNARAVFEMIKEGSKVGSVLQTDPVKISDCFYGKYEETAKNYLSDLQKISKDPSDKSLTAAVITSKDYTALQDNFILGMNEERIRTGVLRQAFQTVNVDQLAGRWLSPAHDLKYHKNIPEGKSPEPSMGGATSVTITLQKHGGAVAITERARNVITDMQVYPRLVSQLQDLREKTENALIAAELESNTGNSITGVDFGARSSGASSNNPVDKLIEFITTFSAKSKDADGFASKWISLGELVANDFVKGNHAPLAPISGKGSSVVAPFPLLPGVTWYADDAISSATAGWLFNRDAIKVFVGPSRQYTVNDPDNETEKYVTKSYLTPETVDSSLIYTVTGIAA